MANKVGNDVGSFVHTAAEDIAKHLPGNRLGQQLDASQAAPGIDKNTPPIGNAPAAPKSPQPQLAAPPTLQQTINKVDQPFLNTLGKAVAAYKAYNPSTATGYSNMSPALQSALTNMQSLTGKALTNLVPQEKAAIQSTVASGQMTSLLNYVASRLVYGDILGAKPQFETPGVQGLYNLFSSISTGGIGGATSQTGGTGGGTGAPGALTPQQIQQMVSGLGGAGGSQPPAGLT